MTSKLVKAMTDEIQGQTKIYGCKDSRHAFNILNRLGVDWSLIATLRLGNKYDTIVGKRTETIGVCTHFLLGRLTVATYSQTLGAIAIYQNPLRLGKIYLKNYNTRNRNHA